MSDTTLLVAEAATPTHGLSAESFGGTPPEIAERMQIVGNTKTEKSRVLNASPAATDYGLVVRPIPQKAATPTVTTVATSTTSATILAANTARVGALIWNDAGGQLFVRLGTTAASGTDFSWRIPANTGWVVPDDYAGALTGVLSGGTGTARVTEW